MITDAQRDFFNIKEEGGPGVVHDPRRDQDGVADVTAKEMAYATRRALVNGQRSVVVMVVIVVVVFVIDSGGGKDHQHPEEFLWHQGGWGD